MTGRGVGDKENRWQRAAGEQGLGGLEKQGRSGKVGSTGCFRRVAFELIKVSVAASADERMTLTS